MEEQNHEVTAVFNEMLTASTEWKLDSNQLRVLADAFVAETSPERVVEIYETFKYTELPVKVSFQLLKSNEKAREVLRQRKLDLEAPPQEPRPEPPQYPVNTPAQQAFALSFKPQ